MGTIWILIRKIYLSNCFQMVSDQSYYIFDRHKIFISKFEETANNDTQNCKEQFYSIEFLMWCVYAKTKRTATDLNVATYEN